MTKHHEVKILLLNADLVSTVARIHVLEEMKVCSVFARVFPGLHLTVDHTCVISIPVYMVDFCRESCILTGREKISLVG